MPFNVKGAVEIPLEVFGGRVTEMAPPDCPEGVSPAEQDNIFLPGSVQSRPSLKKVLINAYSNVTWTYQKSFVTPTGQIINLYLASNGDLLSEDPIGNPGVLTLLAQVPAGSYAKSATMFGREYIAFSDTLHGNTIAYQYDGTNLDRVTQDGPGAPPSVVSIPLASSQLNPVPNTLTRNANTVTANTDTPHNMKVGYQAQISNVPDSNSTSVNQTNTSPSITNNAQWSFVDTLERSNFNPGVSALDNLIFSNFGFSIPSAATILGVTASADLLSQSVTAGFVSQVALFRSGAVLGTAKTPGTPFTPAPTTQSWGSAADQWGAALTPAIINDPTFGFAIACNCDHIRVFIGPPFAMTVFYTLSGSGTVAFIQSIVINNETSPGLALVTTTEPHGLAPEEFVSIVGVEPGTVATITAAEWSSGITTITTATSHNLIPGSIVQISSVATATASTAFNFDGTFTVASVPSPNQITYPQTPITALDPDVINATPNTGNVTIAWPIPATSTPTYFEVESAPTPTTFYIPITYGDGVWSTGTVGFQWEGTFFVTAVITPTQFQYQQYGPNGSTSAVGTVTPFGQAAPGFHLMRCTFLTRNGAVLKSSPFVKFIANGGQYLSVSNIPIGPSNIVARILEFTGADGDQFFYLPATPQIQGQIVGTATQINDNTTTSIVLDFSDNSLFAGLATSIPGNDLNSQIVIDGALGFGYYNTRLITYGQRNRIQNFLNLSFDGGALPSTPTIPSGWVSQSTNGALGVSPLPPSVGWVINAAAGQMRAGQISQSAYEDTNSAPILTGNTPYLLRVFLKPSAIDPQFSFTAQISSPSTGFSSLATISGADMSTSGSWFQIPFSLPTPTNVTQDMVLSIWADAAGAARTLLVDEISIIFSQTPYLDGDLYGSYGNNPEGIDGVTGLFGPVTDTHKVMDFSIMRQTLYMLTRDPSGRLHEITDNGTTEPSGWQVNQVGSNCGLLSAFSLTKSQADDTAASGGEEWMVWASSSGARLFGGSFPDKISQEIQPDWEKINPAAALTMWCVNDPVARTLYFGLPTGTATAPNETLVMSYLELDSAQSISTSPPFRVSFTGKLIATDNARKWSLWNVSANSASLMYRQAGVLSLVLGGGNGKTPNLAHGFGNLYTLDSNTTTDDDYGQINSFYTTYFFPMAGAEAQLQLGSHQKQLAYLMAYVQWEGTMTITPLIENLNNPWPIVCQRTVSQVNFDLEWGGGYARGSRMAFRIQAVPLTGTTGNAYILQRFVAALMPAARLKIRGAAK